MTVAVSVVIPVYNGEETIGSCLEALKNQSLPDFRFEVIVVDDGSTDATASVVLAHKIRLIRQPNRGAPAARNRGIQAARGRWVAFTDADCVPSRTWLTFLLRAVENGKDHMGVLGAAGRLIGYGSDARASRFVDLAGGLDSERHLEHPRYPFAVFGNVLYSRDSLLAVGGCDERFYTYDACDLHTRIMRTCPGEFYFEPYAVVLHRHRSTWRQYWRQQIGYGKGLGQFYWRYRPEIKWSLGREIASWLSIFKLTLAAACPGNGDDKLIRRGQLVKNLAQRIGFATTYWKGNERKKWQDIPRC